MAGGTNCPNKHVLSTQHVPSTAEVPGRVTQLWEKRDHLDPTRYGQTLPRSGALELSLKKRSSVEMEEECSRRTYERCMN